MNLYRRRLRFDSNDLYQKKGKIKWIKLTSEIYSVVIYCTCHCLPQGRDIQYGLYILPGENSCWSAGTTKGAFQAHISL